MLSLIALRLWPFRTGLARIAHLVGMPAPAAPLVARRLRGFPLTLRFNPRTCQGRFLYYRGAFEEHLTDTLRRLLRPGMTFVDVGANAGLFSVVAGHLVGPTGRVIAFEPQRELAAVFSDNMRANGLDNVVLETVALGAAAGMSPLYQVTENDVQATLALRSDERAIGPARHVPLARLDEMLRQHGVSSVDGMKIDVEGAELLVLRGFDSWLAARPPRFVFVECVDHLLQRFHNRSRDLIAFLRAYRYTLYRWKRGRWIPLPPNDDTVTGDLWAALNP